MQNDRFIDYIKELPNYLTAFITPIYFMTVIPMLIEVSRDTGFSAENLNLIVTFFMIGIVTGQLSSTVYNRFLKRKVIFTIGYVLQALLLIGLSFVRDLYLFYMLYLIVGYIAGVVWLQATGNILEGDIKNKDRVTTIFLTFYPLGNFVAPFIASGLVTNNLNWRFYYYISAFFALFILLLYHLLRKKSSEKILADERVEKISLKEIFTDRRTNIIFILGCILLLFYCISETVITTWSPIFLRTIRFFEIERASLAISIFYIAVIGGRVIVSAITGKIKTNYIILFLSILSIASMLSLAYVKSPVWIFVSMIFVGLGCSGIITLGISSSSTVYEKGRSILASIVFAFVNAGTSITPFITKFVSSYSLILSVAMAAIFMFFTFVIIFSKIIYEKNTISG